MRYEGNIFRPFSEANSYILQCTIGCSHKKMHVLRNVQGQIVPRRAIDEVRADITAAKHTYGNLEKVFL